MTADSRAPLRIAVALSAHGLGHAARASAVLDRLADQMPLDLTVLASTDRRIWPARLLDCTRRWIPAALDVGVVQSDDVTVDLEATRLAVEAWSRGFSDLAGRASDLLGEGFDLVLGDVPCAVFPAARAQGIPAVALANFTWDWIYRELGLDAAAALCREAYGEAALLLEAGPAAPMTAFPRRVDLGLVARRVVEPREGCRDRLGLGGEDRVVLLAFQASSAPGLRLPPARPGRVFLAPASWPRDHSRSDLRPLPDGVSFEEALSLADVVVGKPGYGLLGDLEARGSRFLYVPRPGFPENAVLEAWLAGREGTASVSTSRLALGDWEEELAGLEDGDAPAPSCADGAGLAASALMGLLGLRPAGEAASMWTRSGSTVALASSSVPR